MITSGCILCHVYLPEQKPQQLARRICSLFKLGTQLLRVLCRMEQFTGKERAPELLEVICMCDSKWKLAIS